MTVTKEDNTADIVVTAEPDTDADFVTATAIAVEEKPTGAGAGVGQGNEPPIPPGHARFYCSKCRAVREKRRALNVWGGWTRRFSCIFNCGSIVRKTHPLTLSNTFFLILLLLFRSTTIFRVVPQLGDVRDVTLSIPLSRGNVNGVQYCKEIKCMR